MKTCRATFQGVDNGGNDGGSKLSYASCGRRRYLGFVLGNGATRAAGALVLVLALTGVNSTTLVTSGTQFFSQEDVSSLNRIHSSKNGQLAFASPRFVRRRAPFSALNAVGSVSGGWKSWGQLTPWGLMSGASAVSESCPTGRTFLMVSLEPRPETLSRRGDTGSGVKGVERVTASKLRQVAMGEEAHDFPERLSVGGATAAGVSAGAVNVVRPELATLTEEDLATLRSGQRVQKQTRNGGAGTGFVVVDVRADPDIVLSKLTNYEKYAEMIDTVRDCQVFPKRGDSCKVEVTVSRFRLHIRVVMTLVREENLVRFELDPDCTKAGRAVLREATGFFFVETPPDLEPGYSRVWMRAKVDVNRFVPGAIVDYAAGRALPRASKWIKPTCEAAQRQRQRQRRRLPPSAGGRGGGEEGKGKALA
ncbi:unnamed protein product [Discosporangium mesarthrocarpum]